MKSPKEIVNQCYTMRAIGITSFAFDWRDIKMSRWYRRKFIKFLRKECNFKVKKVFHGFIVYL